MRAFGWGKFFLMVAVATTTATTAVAAAMAASEDIAYEKIAYRLELVRNQLDLTIANHVSLKADAARQRFELRALHAYKRIPITSEDTSDDRALLESLAGQLRASGAHVLKIRFAKPWRSARTAVPATVPFGTALAVLDEQVAESRELDLKLECRRSCESSPTEWLGRAQDQARLITETSPGSLSKRGRLISGRALIFRFHDNPYPAYTPPDLSHYTLPGSGPRSNSQARSAERIARYRREIAELWPRAAPWLEDARALAVNDLRMKFFLRRVRDRSHGGEKPRH